MRYFFGLGNPGKDYVRTRHNIGFDLADMFAQHLGNLSWRASTKFLAEVAESPTWRLYKPVTFMNDSGQSVRAVLDFYEKSVFKQKPTELPNVVVAFDDLDLEVGNWKIQYGKGPKVHNGLSSIYEHLGTQQFWHLRIGVDGRQGVRQGSGADYVLSHFPSDQREIMMKVLTEIIPKLDQLQ